jgi:glycosyltransferase involved in cell wall biosynthesis
MADVLVTVSGTIDPARREQEARGERPHADYFAMAQGFGADLLDYAQARKETGRVGWLLERLGGADLTLAWACFRRRGRYRVIFTDGEQVGIPFAGLLKFLAGRRRPRHLMLVHILSVRKKEVFLDYLGLHSHIDTFFVYCTWQKRFVETRWHVPPERVVFTPFMVDTAFFSPRALPAPQPPIPNPQPPTPVLCAVGLERRDYPTLLEAVKGLPVHVYIAAASPWSKRTDSTAGHDVPANVTVRRYTQFELRQLYADSRFLVMPLYDVDFQAGVTAILEAMAMERAVICSRTPGQTDVVVDGETGLYVPPGDPAALRQAIQRLLDNPDEAAAMGRAGRQRVEDEMSLARYVERLARYVNGGK